MNKPTIADILHYAADHCLATGEEVELLPKIGNNGRKQEYSCFAITVAACALTAGTEFPGHSWTGNSARQWYTKSFGIPYNFFPPEFPLEEAQQIRYATLKFAALIAEEEGV